MIRYGTLFTALANGRTKCKFWSTRSHSSQKCHFQRSMQALSAINFAKIHKIVFDITCLQKLITRRQTDADMTPVNNQMPLDVLINKQRRKWNTKMPRMLLASITDAVHNFTFCTTSSTAW